MPGQRDFYQSLVDEYYAEQRNMPTPRPPDNRPGPEILRDYATLEAAAVKYVKEWLAEYGIADNCKRRVIDILDKRWSETLFHLAGLVKHGDEYVLEEEYHQTAAGNYLRDKAAENIKQWLDCTMARWPEPTPAQLAALQTEYLSQYEHTLREVLRFLADRRARGHAERIANTMFPPTAREENDIRYDSRASARGEPQRPDRADEHVMQLIERLGLTADPTET